MKNQRGSIILAILIGLAAAGAIVGGGVVINDGLDKRNAKNHAQDAEAKQILRDQLNEFLIIIKTAVLPK
jgi:parvulin-like peptidyl-prolyl isomerase